MKKTKETRGGARANAGRKKVADKKQAVTIYVEQSKVQRSGGSDALKTKLYNLIS